MQVFKRSLLRAICRTETRRRSDWWHIVTWLHLSGTFLSSLQLYYKVATSLTSKKQTKVPLSKCHFSEVPLWVEWWDGQLLMVDYWLVYKSKMNTLLVPCPCGYVF